jgi:hypothetical protein
VELARDVVSFTPFEIELIAPISAAAVGNT